MCKLNPLFKVSKCNNKSKCKTYFNYQYGMNTITCIGTLWNMQLKKLHLILPYLLKNVCLLLMCQLVKRKKIWPIVDCFQLDSLQQDHVAASLWHLQSDEPVFRPFSQPATSQHTLLSVYKTFTRLFVL